MIVLCCSDRHRQSIINSLQDADISIRRRALDLLFAMCNPSNVREIVGELLSYLQVTLNGWFRCIWWVTWVENMGTKASL